MQAHKNAIEFFAKYIFSQIGIEYSELNFYQLETRLIDVAKQLGLADVEALHESARREITPAMKLLILDLATNNETLFFRDPAVFSAIETIVLGEQGISRSRTTPFRVWSAACSTGQEVYSLAIMLDRLRSHLPQGKYEIVATDISERVLRQAEAGNFTQLQVQRGLSAALLLENFTKLQNRNDQFEWQIRPDLKRNISFRKLNLLDSFAGLGTFDLVMCRNVLIYQSQTAKRDILERIHERLDEGGFLVLGAAESLIGLSTQFDMARTEKATIYRKITATRRAG